MAFHLCALAQIETGGDNRIVGKFGEVSEYQLTPVLWRKYAGRANPVDPNISTPIAQSLLQSRVAEFERNHKTAPTPEQIYLLWHRPARVLRPTDKELERAQRFANLVKLYEPTKRLASNTAPGLGVTNPATAGPARPASARSAPVRG